MTTPLGAPGATASGTAPGTTPGAAPAGTATAVPNAPSAAEALSAAVGSAAPLSSIGPAPADGRDRPPRGYTPTYLGASFGLFLAILAPVLGGLSVKVQNLVGVANAAQALGLVTGVGALFALVAQPLVGRLSDRTVSRFGMRKPWIFVGVGGAFLALVGVGLAPNIPVLVIAWCAAQVFSNFAQAAETATIADQVPERRRGMVSGLAGAASPIAILVGAILLDLLPNDFLRASIPAAIGLVLGLVFALALKDRIRAAKPERPFDLKEFFGSFVFNPRIYRSFAWAWLTKAMIMFGYASVSSYLTLFLANDFGMNTKQQLSFNLEATFVSVAAIVVFSVVGGPLSDRLGRRRIFVVVGGLILAVGLLAMGLAPFAGQSGGLTLILVSEAFIGAGAGLFLSVDTALCIQLLPNPDDTAKDLGVLNIANTLPQTVAPFVAGVIIIPLADHFFGGGGYTVWFLFGAAVSAVGGVLVFKIKGVK